MGRRGGTVGGLFVVELLGQNSKNGSDAPANQVAPIPLSVGDSNPRHPPQADTTSR